MSELARCSLSARRVEKGRQALGHLADLLDRPTDRLRRPIQVQDQAIPQTLGGLQAVRPPGDHPRLVVDPLHRRTRLMRFKVVQDLRLPAVVGREERAEVQPKPFGLIAESPQPPRGCGAVRGRVEDLLEPETDPVQLPQRGDLLEQALQRLLLLGCQARGVTAEGPHLRAERLPLGLGQLCQWTRTLTRLLNPNCYEPEAPFAGRSPPRSPMIASST